MFNTYFQLGYRIRKHYLSPRVILALATGRFVPPIHRRNLYSLQYSMLPARRAGIGEVWGRLTEERTGVGVGAAGRKGIGEMRSAWKARWKGGGIGGPGGGRYSGKRKF